jgi:hypothetical protein
MAYTYTELLDDIKTIGAIPTSQNTYTAARILSATNRVLRSRILPIMSKCRENYYSYDVDTSVNSSGQYNIPSRAMGGKIQNLALINSTERLDLSWLSEEELSDTSESPYGSPGVYVKRNSVYLVPAQDHGYSTFRMSIYLRPCEVVAQSSAAQITAINTGTNTLTFTSGTIPTSWTTSNTFELVQQNPHFDTLGYDLAISSITTTTMVFSATLNTRLAVGDWVGLTGQSPIIQIPLEAQPLLAQLVSNELTRNSTNKAAYKLGVENAKDLEKELMHLLTPRIDKEGKKLVSRNGIFRRING